jgi:hypothetical protein
MAQTQPSGATTWCCGWVVMTGKLPAERKGRIKHNPVMIH